MSTGWASQSDADRAENLGRLDSCPLHDFIMVRSGSAETHRKAVHRCAHCGGEVLAPSAWWYKTGRKHGERIGREHATAARRAVTGELP